MKISMKPSRAARGIVCALALAAPAMIVPHAAFAQNYEPRYQRTREGPRIDGFDVKAVPALKPGTDLDFTVWGTPGGTATVKIDGTDSKLLLQETDVGRYQGSYTIRIRDRLTPATRVTANLRVGNQVVGALLDDNLVIPPRQARRAPNPAYGPRIERFEVQPAPVLAPGEDLGFALYGEPGGRANVRIDGLAGRVFLDEVKPGNYEGTYTIRGGDRISPNAAATATLIVGDRSSTAVLGRPLLAAAPPPRQAPRQAPRCWNCATVVTTNIIEVKGEGGYLGAIAGGLAGGLLGHQVGEGRGKTAAEIAGAVGGALGGREIERSTQKSKHYEVVVKLPDGGTQAFEFPTDPGFREGERVRIDNGALVRDE